MAEGPVHYELFVRRNVQAGWTLDQAGEDRAPVVEAAESALREQRAVGVKVCKETRRSSGEYLSVVVFSRGDLEPPRKKGRGDEDGPAPLCVGPSDLYTVHARARIARLFEGFLRRQGVTPFELLHRPDLVEQLEAAGLEIQGAIQKVAVPEAKASGASTHDTVRRFQRLADGAVARLLGDARRGVFPDIARDGLPGSLRRAEGLSDAPYLLGVAVARHLAPARGWTARIGRLLDLAEACPAGDGARALLLQVLEQPLTEILGHPGALAADGVDGVPAPLGRTLALMTGLVLGREAQAFVARDAEVARIMPPPSLEGERLARWLREPAFAASLAALGRRVLEELAGPRRLHPDDPAGEIVAVRVLARLLMLSPKAAPPEAVEAAVAARSRALVSADFVEAYLAQPCRSHPSQVQAGGGALGEAMALVRLGENVVGPANRRAAGEWLRSHLGSNRLERALRGEGAAAHRLACLAELQRGLDRMGLEAELKVALSLQIGELADPVEADARLIGTLVRGGPGAALGRLAALLRLASGEGAPHGPVTRRARAEALKLARDPTLRAELTGAAPAEMERARLLLQAAGRLAA